MDKTLAQQVFDYSVDKKYADETFIRNVLDVLLADELSIIKPIISDKAFSNGIIKNKYATKYFYSDEIYVYLNNIEEILFDESHFWKQIANSLDLKRNDKEIILYFQYNLSVIRMLVFQIEHIKKYLNYGKSENIEDILFELGSKMNVRYAYLKNKFSGKKCIINEKLFSSDFINNIDKEYSRYKLIIEEHKQLSKIQCLSGKNPSNRIAHIKSVNFVNDILDEMNVEEDIKQILIYINEYYRLHFTFTNYYSSEKILLNPLKRFTYSLDLFGEYYIENKTRDELENIIESNNNLPISERIYYGLELTRDEYSKICKGKIKII